MFERERPLADATCRRIAKGVMRYVVNNPNPFIVPAWRRLPNRARQRQHPAQFAADAPLRTQEREQILKAARPDELQLVRFWLNSGLAPRAKSPQVAEGGLDEPPRAGGPGPGRVGIENVPKTAAGVRDVDLNDEAMAALIAQKPSSFGAGEHVFLNPRTGEAWSTDAQVRKTLWTPLLERTGVRYRNPYQCRHLREQPADVGAQPAYVAEQLGHVDVQIVSKIYGKCIPQDYQKPKAQPALRGTCELPCDSGAKRTPTNGGF